MPTDSELDWSLVWTGPGKIENPHDIIEIYIAMIGAVYPTEMNKPMAMGDVAGAGGPATTGASGPLLLTAVVLPPDSEVVAPFALNDSQLGTCALIVPSRDLTEEFGVVVGHTLVDASRSSANVLIINPNAEEVVLPCKTCIGKLVPISAVSVVRSELQLPADGVVLLPEYLEDIVKGSHPSLGETGR